LRAATPGYFSLPTVYYLAAAGTKQHWQGKLEKKALLCHSCQKKYSAGQARVRSGNINSWPMVIISGPNSVASIDANVAFATCCGLQ